MSSLVVLESSCQPVEVLCVDLADPWQAPGFGHACCTTNCA